MISLVPVQEEETGEVMSEVAQSVEAEERAIVEALIQSAADWPTVGHIVTAAETRPDAVDELCTALGISLACAEAILDQPLSTWLPEHVHALRSQLDA
ncbi:MAG: hypothetical protein ACJ72A_04570 [Nocardioidaceae bacterium]|jgi:hypothetical protein